MGAQDTARTPVSGIFFDSRFGGQYLTFDSPVLPDYSPAPPAASLAVYPPAEYGWENITFLASDGPAFSPGTLNGTYFANISRIYLKTRDTIATTSGMTPAIGSGWGAGYQVNTTIYPASSSLKMEIWEGAVSNDRRIFDYIASHAEIPHLFRDIAYTAKITKTSYTGEGGPG